MFMMMLIMMLFGLWSSVTWSSTQISVFHTEAMMANNRAICKKKKRYHLNFKADPSRLKVTNWRDIIVTACACSWFFSPPKNQEAQIAYKVTKDWDQIHSEPNILIATKQMWTYHWNNDIFRESTPPRNLILVSPEQCWHFWTHQFDKIAFQLCYIWYMYIYFYVGIQKYTSVTYNLSCKSYTEVTFWENTLFGISVVMIVSFWDKNV